MTSLNDTPTPVILPSEANEVSIKIEQGVLCENGKDVRNKVNVETRDVPIIKCESNLPSTTENILNGMNEDFNIFNTTHSIFQPHFVIKTEPDMDIDDRQPEEEAEHMQSTNKLPKITLTPTSKLVASTNGASDKKRRYFCTYENCTKSYGKSSHLRSHLTWHTGIKPFVCKEPSCGKGFTRSDELNRHIRTHTGEKPFECVQCTKKFSRSDHLTKHLATHTKQLSAYSGVLNRKTKSEKNISPSNVKVGPATLSSSSINGIQNTFRINSVDSSERISDCVKTTRDESLKIKQEQPDNTDYVVAILNQDTGANSCIYSSDQKTNNEYNFIIKPEPIGEPQVNKLPQYSNEPDDDAIMPEANLPPLTENAASVSVVKVEEPPLLKETINHMADSVYDPTRPFPCFHCAKNFKRQDDLNRHMRTHTGEKPFACNECDKRFMRSDHLKKHLK